MSGCCELLWLVVVGCGGGCCLLWLVVVICCGWLLFAVAGCHLLWLVVVALFIVIRQNSIFMGKDPLPLEVH